MSGAVFRPLCDEYGEQAEEGTAGRIRMSQDAIARIAGLRDELKRLREMLRKAK